MKQDEFYKTSNGMMNGAVNMDPSPQVIPKNMRMIQTKLEKNCRGSLSLRSAIRGRKRVERNDY